MTITASEAAAALGRISTPKKAKAAKENRALGGGMPAGTKLSEETKAKMRAAWVRRKARKTTAENSLKKDSETP